MTDLEQHAEKLQSDRRYVELGYIEFNIDQALPEEWECHSEFLKCIYMLGALRLHALTKIARRNNIGLLETLQYELDRYEEAQPRR